MNVDPRYMKLSALITQAKTETGNFQRANPAEVNQVKALQSITEALSIVEALLNDIRYKAP